MASLLYLVNKVAEAIEEEYPNVVISTLAYLETVKPPKTIRPRKNVAIRLCNDAVGSWVHPFTPVEQCHFGELLKAWSNVHNVSTSGITWSTSVTTWRQCLMWEKTMEFFSSVLRKLPDARG